MKISRNNIIVIDSTTERGHEMVLSFRNQSENGTEVYLFDTNKEQVLSDMAERGMFSEVSNENDFLIMFIHARDRQWMNAVNPKLRIWYGGHAGFDPDVPSGEEKIDRAIVNNGFLEDWEIDELLLYAKGKGPRPKFLLQINHDEFLRTENAIALIHELSVPDAELIRNMVLPESLQEFQVEFEEFRSEALKLINLTPNITPFNSVFLKMLTKLKTAIFSKLGV